MPQPGLDPASVRREERRRRIRVLLESRFDYLPSTRSTMPVTNSGPAGESKHVPCETCRGRGRLLRKGPRRGTRVSVRCLACDGTGERLRRKADPAYDSYVGELRPEGRARVMTAREYDDQIARLRADELARQGRVEHERYGFERAHDARDRSGSYRELDAAVRELQRRAPGTRLSSPRAVALLEELMPPSIRVPPWALEQLAQERQPVILDLAALGWSAREIGRALGISAEKVRRLLKKGPRRTQLW